MHHSNTSGDLCREITFVLNYNRLKYFMPLPIAQPKIIGAGMEAPMAIAALNTPSPTSLSRSSTHLIVRESKNYIYFDMLKVIKNET